MEFAYAHAQCNLFKSDVILCSPRAAGARARDDDVEIEDTAICMDIISQKYKDFTTKMHPTPQLKSRTLNMFNHLDTTLRAVQESYFERNPLHDNTSAVLDVINQNPDTADIKRNTLIAMNMQFAMNAPQIYDNIKKINNIQAEIISGNIANKSELVRLVRQLNDLWPGTAERFGFDEYLRSEQYIMTTPPRTLIKNSAAGGEDKSETSKNNTRRSRRLNEINTSLSSANTSQSSPGYMADTASSTAKKRRKLNNPTKGGTIKNKRRSQKRFASSRRKRNKRSSTRRKIYTRKQKK
jgi:hypothetical protein